MRYLIFGGTGSLGKKLIERYCDAHNDVCIFSRDEAKHWTLRNKYVLKQNLTFCVGDIRDKQRVREIFYRFKPNYVIIAAALKQVDTCELAAAESIKTNILGTQNIVDVIKEYERHTDTIKRALFVSTDKACSPVNVYGMCKAISERIVTNSTTESVEMVSTRYGNVLESRGSIIPLFKYQSLHANELTVTDPEMTRFLMTLDESVDLIDYALHDKHVSHGQTIVPKLPSMKIGDLADIFSNMSSKPIRVVGHRPGEKKHEQLINESESTRTLEITKDYYAILSSMSPHIRTEQFNISSDGSVLGKDALKRRLESLGVMDADISSFIGKEIEELAT